MKTIRKAALLALLFGALLIGCSPLKTLSDPKPEVTATPSPSPAANPRPAPSEDPGRNAEQEKTDRDKEETVYIKAGADAAAVPRNGRDHYRPHEAYPHQEHRG